MLLLLTIRGRLVRRIRPGRCCRVRSKCRGWKNTCGRFVRLRKSLERLMILMLSCIFMKKLRRWRRNVLIECEIKLRRLVDGNPGGLGRLKNSGAIPFLSHCRALVLVYVQLFNLERKTSRQNVPLHLSPALVRILISLLVSGPDIYLGVVVLRRLSSRTLSLPENAVLGRLGLIRLKVKLI